MKQFKALPRQQQWVIAVAVVIIAIVIGSALGSQKTTGSAAAGASVPATTTPTTAGSASYTASFQPDGLMVIDPADIRYFITVENTGDASGTPTCTINLSSPGGGYTGFDGITPTNPIKAGGTESYADTISVTGQGASYITLAASTVTCT